MSNQIIVVTTQANGHALLHKYTGLPQELEAYVPGAKMVTSVSPGYVFSIVESPSYPGQIGIIADFGNNEYGQSSSLIVPVTTQSFCGSAVSTFEVTQ